MAHGIQGPTKSLPDNSLRGEAFRKRYRWLVLATWTLPVLIGTTFEIFMGLVRAEEVFLTIFAGFTGPFVLLFLIFATVALDRRARRIIGLVAELPHRSAAATEIKVAVHNLVAIHVGLFLFFCIVGPQTTLLTDYFLYPDSYSPTSSFNLLIGMLPPILLIALPLFFLVTDTLGRFLAPRGVMFDLAPLRLKFVILGLVTPALVDMTLLLYFYDRTGYFHAETIFVWLALLFVAGLVTALAWRSLGQSLTPLQEGLAGRREETEAARRPLILPQSLDELGILAVDWNRTVAKERQQEARYRDLVEGSIQGIFIVQGMRVVFANSAFANMMGYDSVSDVFGLPDAASFVAPEDRERILGYAQARREGREAPDRYEVRAVRADGSLTWQDVVARPVQWNGAPALQLTVIDISERKRVEGSLRESEARFRDLIEGSIQGILIHRHHEIIFANQALADMLRYDRADEVVALQDVLKFVHRDDRERMIAYRERRMAGADVPSRYEFRIVAKDGSTIWVENVARLVDWDEVKAIQSTFVDITERKRAEESLRESEARFRDLIEGSIQGIFVHRDFRLLFANRAMAEIMGYESVAEFLEAGSVLAFIPDEERSNAEEIKNARRAGEVVSERYELRTVRRDGSTVWLENVARAVNWNGARAIQATVVDVTERKLAEEALRLSEESLRNAQRIAQMGSWDWNIAENVLRWSDGIYRLFGMEPHAFPATYEAFLGYIHPDDRELVETAVAKALSDNVPYSVDHRILLADGSIKFVHEQAEIIRDPAGLPVRMSGAVHDVSELYFAEEALRESENSLRQAQRIARIGSWEKDIESGQLYWSDEMYNLFGFEKGEVEPSLERFMEFVHPDDADALRANIEEAIAGIRQYNIDFRVVRSDGQEIVLHAQGEVDRDAVGRPVHFRGTAQDVTELRKAEAEVRRLNEELEMRVEDRTRELREAQAELIKKSRLATLGQLTATVSHELRNPLGAMRTSAYVLAKSLPDENEGALKAIARIDRGIARCDRIIDELLDFTRSTEIDRKAVAVDGWLRAVLSEMTIPVGVKLETELQLGNLEAMLDSGRLRRAIINIVDNACQAITGQSDWDTRTGAGIVHVSTGKINSDIEIRISDNGSGIPADIRGKIFEPLFSTKNFGVGLGLPTVRQILEHHGGTVTVESEPGAGALFRLAFPYVKPGKSQETTVGKCFPAPLDRA